LVQLRHWGRQGVRTVSADPLCYCSYQGLSLDIIRCLVRELGADIKLEYKGGDTPLCFAVKEGRLATVKCLVTEFGADVNQADTVDGRTPLMLAAYHEHLDVLSCLLELGADINKADNEGRTALLDSAALGRLAMISCLLKSRADVDQADIQGRPPLFWAAKHGHLAVVRCLLKHEANVNHAAKLGPTPLMVASLGKHAEVVTWLIKAGADPQASIRISDGITRVAANLFRGVGASAEQTVYLEAKTHCSNTGCSGAGIKKCPACKQARYCGESCQLAHWKAHKADCKRWSAELKAGKGK
jgi:ankyrin repeat protein